MRSVLKRPPDFLIGPDSSDPYMERWWVLPRNRWFNVYLHHIRHSDDDRALHDHPYWNMSIVLRGGYEEHTPRGVKRRRPGSIVFRRATALHRLVVDQPAWSLFITGPRIREWGFQCPQGWRHWRDFVAPDDAGKVGRGCGE